MLSTGNTFDFNSSFNGLPFDWFPSQLERRTLPFTTHTTFRTTQLVTSAVVTVPIDPPSTAWIVYDGIESG